MVLLSTDSPVDLSERNDAFVTFSRHLPPLAEARLLANPHRWFVGSRHSCSCGFRHLHGGSVELGFAPPVDWFPEEGDDVEATVRFVQVVRNLLAEGAAVDIIDAWGHESELAALDGTVEVDLSKVGDREFRFFENYRFVVVAEPNRPSATRSLRGPPA